MWCVDFFPRPDSKTYVSLALAYVETAKRTRARARSLPLKRESASVSLTTKLLRKFPLLKSELTAELQTWLLAHEIGIVTLVDVSEDASMLAPSVKDSAGIIHEAR